MFIISIRPLARCPGSVFQAATRAGLAIGLINLAVPLAWPQPDLTEASLEQLMNVQVTSVSKKEQKLARTAAAVFVISQEDIRRSGATSIPDVLRMAPGVDVARIDNSNWAVSIRGFNNLYANKLLVLVDGQSVYSDSFSGVYWGQLDVPLEDIERIEVIRGPGGTVWGANAVNGVISIITKPAKATQGGLVSGGAGSKDRASGLLQYGGTIGQVGAYRVFGRYSNIANSTTSRGAEAPDSRRMSQGGFRSDWNLSTVDQLTLQGNVLTADGGNTYAYATDGQSIDVSAPSQASVGDVLGRWEHSFKSGSELSVQGFYNYYRRTNQGIEERLQTAGAEFQQHLHVASRHDVVWGLEYRVSNSAFVGSSSFTLRPSRRTAPLFSGFVQDEIKLTDTLALTVGAKFEHNSYTGYENEPSAQLVWTPTARQTVWASVAKAIRQPSLVDNDVEITLSTMQLPPGGLGELVLFGNPKTKAEELRDVEAGYRAEIGRKLTLDLTAFLSSYQQLQTSEPGVPFFSYAPGPPHLVIPLVFDNLAHAHDYGAEISVNWMVMKGWRVSPGLSFLNMSVVRDPSSRDSSVERLPQYSPGRQYQVRSLINLPHHWEWDQTAGYTSALAGGDIASFARLDTRLGWRWGEGLDFSVVGQNLLQPRHAEFPDTAGLNHTLIQRSVFGKITWRF